MNVIGIKRLLGPKWYEIASLFLERRSISASDNTCKILKKLIELLRSQQTCMNGSRVTRGENRVPPDGVVGAESARSGFDLLIFYFIDIG